MGGTNHVLLLIEGRNHESKGFLMGVSPGLTGEGTRPSFPSRYRTVKRWDWRQNSRREQIAPHVLVHAVLRMLLPRGVMPLA